MGPMTYDALSYVYLSLSLPITSRTTMETLVAIGSELEKPAQNECLTAWLLLMKNGPPGLYK